MKGPVPQPLVRSEKKEPKKKAVTAHEMWMESGTSIPFAQWEPTEQQQAQLEQKFGGRKERG